MTAELRALILRFKQETYPNQWADYDNKDFVPVASLDDCDTASGECFEVSTHFIYWLSERGVEACLVETEDVNQWGMNGVNRYGVPSDSADHAAVVITDNGREWFVDWTASQFGERAFPYIKLWKDVTS